jgi:selenocysteine lyase/cysteine desulfurase
MTSAAPAPLSLDDAAALWDVTPGFLDSCSYGPPPRPAWAALQQSLDEWRAGAGPWQPWAATVDRSRELFGQLVGLGADHVATGATVSQLLAPVAAALPDGAMVLVPDIEFTSGVFPFAVQQYRGIRVRAAPLAHLAEAIDESTTLVSFSAAQSATGEVADIAAITERARAAGAVTHMDTTQAAGWLPIDGSSVDFLTCHAYKWLCAPRGSTFMTLHPDLVERHPKFARRVKPLAAGWYSGAAGAYYGMPLRLAEDARAFDISPAWHSWVGTAPALEILLRVGVAEIHQHNLALANAFRAGVGLPESNSAIVSVALPEDAVARMRAAGLRFTVMDGRVRVAFHLYTTRSDVNAALEAILG